MRPRLLLVMVLGSLIALAATATAHAAFPGANGRIAESAAFGDQSEPREVLTVNPDGTGTLHVSGTSLQACDVRFPSWSPDGTKLAWARERGSRPDCFDHDLEIANANGTGQVTRVSAGEDTQPAWSPDSTRLAFVNGGDVHVIGVPFGGPDTNITNTAVQEDAPAWSPDGTKIAYQRLNGFNWDLWVMNADGSGQTPLQTTSLNEERPNWSPDGTKLVFDAQAGGSSVNPSDLYSINPDGTGLTNLTNSTALEFEAAWSPDGAQVVYQGYQEYIWAMNADGSNQHQVTSDATRYDYQPDWQPLPGSSPAPPYPTPKLASPIRMALVPVLKQCGTAGNPTTGSHSPPLATGSCAPQPQGVARFGAQAQGTAWIATIYGDTNAANGDQADATFRLALSDIQTAGGVDYDPNPAGADATLVTRLRFTDQANGGSGTDPGTASDFDFSVPFACTATANPAVGSDCGLDTSADAVTPGMIKENKATVLQVFRLRLNDSGPNGTRGDGDDRLFASEGVFVP
jgi:TolB protein